MIKRYTIESIKAQDKQILGISKWCCQDEVKVLEDKIKLLESSLNKIEEDLSISRYVSEITDAEGLRSFSSDGLTREGAREKLIKLIKES